MEMRTEGPVEQAVRQALGTGCTLLTPGIGFPPQRQKKFTAAPDSDVVNISQITKQYVTWGILEGVVPYMLERDGIVEIGAKNSTNAKPDTLDSYLKSSYKVSLRTATYVAPILEKPVWFATNRLPAGRRNTFACCHRSRRAAVNMTDFDPQGGDSNIG